MINKLHPAQRFMYEYGCFTSFWSNFELMMEVAIHKYSGDSAIDNCKKINKLTAGVKKKKLAALLEKNSEQEKLNSLNNVFEVADRNDWIHGHILNPKGDFSQLTRLRVIVGSDSLEVSNTPIDGSNSSFDDFYSAWADFQNIIALSVDECNEYLINIQKT
jgi:hypothetical protein